MFRLSRPFSSLRHLSLAQRRSSATTSSKTFKRKSGKIKKNKEPYKVYGFFECLRCKNDWESSCTRVKRRNRGNEYVSTFPTHNLNNLKRIKDHWGYKNKIIHTLIVQPKKLFKMNRFLFRRDTYKISLQF